MRIHVVRPKDSGPEKKYPGIVFYSEIFQVTGPIRRTAARLAGEGFIVAVPEVYHELMGEPGRVLSYTPEDSALGNKCKTDRPLSAYDSDFKAAVAFLLGHAGCSGRVGVAGVCLGGGLAVRAALSSINPAVSAIAAWYPTGERACAARCWLAPRDGGGQSG